MPLTVARPSLRTADTRSLKAVPKKVDAFYTSKPWRDLMAALIRERGRFCQMCGRDNTRIFGDHIKELRDGGAALDPAGIILLCGSCHTRVTAQRRAARMLQPVIRDAP